MHPAPLFLHVARYAGAHVQSELAAARAIANGAVCEGLWMSHPIQSATEPVAWKAMAVTPSPDPGVPVLLWQYMFPRDGASIDRSLVNPNIDAQMDLLRYLVLPPGTANVA